MPLSTSCPNCQALFRLSDDTVGKKVKCQKCSAIFVVPPSDGATTTPGISVPGSAPVAMPANEPVVDKANPMPPPLPNPASVPTATAFVDSDGDDEPKAKKKTKDSDPDRPRPSSRRRDKPAKSNSATTALVVVLVGAGLFSCLVCSGAMGYWYYSENKANRAIAKKRDVVKKDLAQNFDRKDGPFDGVKDKDFFKKNDFGVKDRDFIRKDFKEFPLDMGKDGFQKRQVGVIPAGGIPLALDKEGTVRLNQFLELNDPRAFNGKIHKQYTIQLVAGKQYWIEMQSVEFDAYLYLIDDANDLIAEDDDSGGVLDSRIVFQPTRTAQYRIQATSFGGGNTGNYTLIVRRLN